MGYGVLPENPDPTRRTYAKPQESAAPSPQPQQPARRATASDEFTVVQAYSNHIGGVTYYVEAGPGALPYDTKLNVSPINGNSLKDKISPEVKGKILSVYALDFLFYDPNGVHVTPEQPVRVALYPATWDYTTEFILIAQIDSDGTVQILKRFDDIREVATGLRFEAEQNAIYAIVFCVSEA